MKQIILCDDGNIVEVSKLCRKYHIGVNIDRFYKPDYLENSPNAINEHLECYKNIDICSIHGPFADLNFGSSDVLIREVTAKRFEYAYDISCKLGCKNIILHNGYVPGTSTPSNWIKRGRIFWDDFLNNKNRETIFYIENLLEHDPEIINDVINMTSKNNLKICFDTGHTNVFSKIKITEWIEKMNKNIGFVHLHNNYGERDEHNGLDNGNINMMEICIALEQYSPNAIWAIENLEYKKSIEWLIGNKYI
jgi:sugar phosphate isomerase/epimerase